MNLGKEIIDNLILEAESNIKTIVAIYPGRFQPMGKHHAKVYDWLAGKFGKSNTYIATSDKVALPKSPLNFREKVQVIRKHGIQNVVQERNVYAPENILKKYNPETTAVVFVYGKKDAGRLRYTKKDGTPGYFQEYEKSKGNLKGYETHGYVVIAPHIELKIPGFGEMSGTTLRAALATADMKTFKDIMGWYDPKLYELLRKKFSQSINEFLIKNNLQSILKEGSSANGLGDGIVDDGPRYFYGDQKTYRKKTAEMAQRLGYEVVNYILKDNPLEIHDTNYPDGPPLTVSYFPTGVKGGEFAGTDYIKDYKGKPGYNIWKKYISKIAQTVGYKFLNFLGAEDSIDSSKGEVLKPTGLTEDINLPINIGDTVMMGRFKNKPVVVKSINFNDKGDLLINGRSAARFRITPKEDSEQSLTKEWWSNTFKQLLTEGGAAGHMNHPFDDRDLTFGDMKQMIRLSLEGQLDLETGVQEKTDGQNLLVTYKDGRVKAARNKTTIRTPLNPEQVKMKFAGRGEIENAFTFAMLDLEKAFEKLPQDRLQEIFQNGSRFLNIEIIYPGTQNVVMYGSQAYLQFHGVSEYDLETANKIGDVPELASLLQKMIADVNANIQKEFAIIPPKILTLNKMPNFEEKEQFFINRVTKLQNQFKLKDTDEVIQWHEEWWKTKIEQLFPETTDEIKFALLKRWAYYDKSFRLNGKNIPDTTVLQKIKDFDKTNFTKQNKQNVYNFEKIFLELGVEILANISDYLSVVPKKAVKDIRKRIANKIKFIQKSNDLKALEKMKFELERIKAIGGFEKLVPTEGIVFVYKGKTYKLTGLFAPINQLLGIGGLGDK
jgi:hypothetical protein